MNEMRPFRYWVQNVLPQVYDDSLSYYELLNKVVAYLNRVIDNVNALNKEVDNVEKSIVELKKYIDSYFDSEDFQQIVEDKLDEMVEAGTFDGIITPILERLEEELIGRVEILEDGYDSFVKVLFPPSVQSPMSNYPAGACQAIIKDGHATLIDLGVYAAFQTIRDALVAQGVEVIDNIIISHFHGDHTGINESVSSQYGLDHWKNAFDMRNVHCYVPNDATAPEAVSSTAFRACFDPSEITTLTENGEFLSWNGGKFEAYNISTSDFAYYGNLNAEYNAYSMLCYATFGDIVIGNTADFVKVSEEHAYASGYCRKCTVMTAPHHGINGEGDSNFAIAMSPCYTYIPDNYRSLINGYRDASIASLVGISRFFTNTQNGDKGVMFFVNKAGICVGASPSVISKYSFATPTVMYVNGSVNVNEYQDGTVNHPFKYIRRAVSSLVQGGRIVLLGDIEDTLYLTGAQGFVEVVGNSHTIPYINLSAGADVRISDVSTDTGVEINASKIKLSNFTTGGTIYLRDAIGIFDSVTVTGDRIAFDAQRSILLVNFCYTPDRTNAQLMYLAQSIATGSIRTEDINSDAHIPLVGSIGDFGRLRGATTSLLSFWSNNTPPLIVYDTTVNKYGMIQSDGTIKYVVMETE